MRRRVWRRHFLARRAALAACAATAALTGWATPAAAAGDLEVVTVDTARHPEVTLTVTAPAEVADRVLGADAFTLTENGEPRLVTVERTGSDSLQVVLVIDTSGSMEGAPIDAAKGAAEAFVARMPAGTTLAVVGFGDTPTVLSPPSTDPAPALAAIRSLTVAGETALYDAIDTGLRQFTRVEDGRYAMVVLSDGGDTASAADLSTIRTWLGQGTVEFAALALVTPEYDGAALEQLAGAAGGVVVPAESPDQLAGVYEAVASDLVNRYELTYESAAGGDTRVAIALASGGVSASAERTVRLPALAVTERAPAPVPQVVGDPGFLGSRAALLVGAGAFAVALAVVGGFLFRPRETRVRLFGRGRGTATERLGVSHFAEQATAAAERALARRGLASGVNGRLERAGLDLRAGEYVVLTATAAIALFAAGALMGSPVVGFVLGALVVAAASVVLDHLARRRAQRFADQLADTLQMISGSLRAGYSFLQATDTVSREASSPTAEEFNRMLVEIRLGRDFSDALRAMHARIGNEDFEWFIQAVEIQREVGGDLAQILDTVAGTIRERNRLRRQVKALSAEGRLSAIILFALPFVVGGFITVTNPDYLSPLTETTTGTLMLGFAGVLLGVGGLWLRKIIRLVF